MLGLEEGSERSSQSGVGTTTPGGLSKFTSLALQRKIWSPWLGMEGLNVDFDSSVWLTVPDLICQSPLQTGKVRLEETMHVLRSRRVVKELGLQLTPLSLGQGCLLLVCFPASPYLQ